MLFDSSIWILFMAVCRIMPVFFATQINSLTLQSQSPTFSYAIVCTQTQRYSPKTKITQSSSLRIMSMPWTFPTRLPSIWPNPWELSLKKTTKSTMASLSNPSRKILPRLPSSNWAINWCWAVNVLKVYGKAFDEALSAIVELTGSDTPKLIL
jgi:hypothetical protein